MKIESLVVKELYDLPRPASCEYVPRICLAGKFKNGAEGRSHNVFDDPGLTPDRVTAVLQGESVYTVNGNIGAQLTAKNNFETSRIVDKVKMFFRCVMKTCWAWRYFLNREAFYLGYPELAIPQSRSAYWARVQRF